MTEGKKMPETWLEAMRGEPDQRRLVGLPRPPTLEEALGKLVDRYKSASAEEHARYRNNDPTRYDASGRYDLARNPTAIKLSFAEDLLAELRG